MNQVINVGSSPRIRGKCTPQYDDRDQLGIIPANTGKIPPATISTPVITDHPREYGENIEDGSGYDVGHGSSPRIRGKFLVLYRHVTCLGIIPANTGKMTLVVRAGSVKRDHPREYGENWMVLMTS